MKPFQLAIGLAATWLCVASGALAQAPAGEPLPLWMPPAPGMVLAGPGSSFMGPPVWGTIPPPRPLPYGYWWNEYRGADIEHPLYAPHHAPRQPHYVQPVAAGPGLITNFSCWFDKLFRCKHSTQSSACVVCQTTNVPLPPVPSAPSLAVPSPVADEPYADLQPDPVPLIPLTPRTLNSVPQRELSAAPAEQDAPLPQTLSASPTTEEHSPSPATPLRLSPAAELPETPTTRSPEPTTITETQPVPADPLPASDVQLPPARSPVVELAPEFPIPPEPAVPPAAPRNAIPAPAPPAPAPSAPRNKIPSQRRGSAKLP